MTEEKPIYLMDTTGEYWQKVAEKERNKAADNLRLAAERASEIEDLQTRLKDAQAEIDRLKKVIDAAKSALLSYKFGNSSPELAEMDANLPIWIEIIMERMK